MMISAFNMFNMFYVQYALNHEEIKIHPERISKIKPFIN